MASSPASTSAAISAGCRVTPGCAIDARPPARWMTSTTSRGVLADARHERRLARRREIDRTPPAATTTCPASHQRARDHRPPDRCARPRRGRRQQMRRRRCATPSARQPRADLAHALDAAGALRPEKLRQRGVRGIDEVAEDVDVAALVDGGDLDAVDELDVDRASAGAAHLRQAGDRVVIGDAHHRDPGRDGALDEPARRAQPAVRRGGVEVEIDHEGRQLSDVNGRQRAGKSTDGPCAVTVSCLRGLAASRPCRRSRARYSRISISR